MTSKMHLASGVSMWAAAVLAAGCGDDPKCGNGKAEEGEACDDGNDVDDAGLSDGLWYYRVSAVMEDDDADNPGGETLPSDPLPVVVPDVTLLAFVVTLSWDEVEGAALYRVYRSPAAGDGADAVRLLAEVDPDDEGRTYVDAGDATGAEAPRQPGDLGVWSRLPRLDTPRAGLGLSAAADPSGNGRVHVYAVGGRDEDGDAVDTYERLTLTPDGDGYDVGATWVQGGANALREARYGLSAVTVDATVTRRVADDEVWIFAGPGWGDGGGVVAEAESAQVQAGGALTAWRRARTGGGDSGPQRAGYGAAAAANQIFVFGGALGQPSSSSLSGLLCGPGGPGGCTTSGTVRNWNGTGASMAAARLLPGTAVGGARIFLVGGADGGGPLRAVESVLW